MDSRLRGNDGGGGISEKDRGTSGNDGDTSGNDGGTSEKDRGKNETDAGMTRHAALTRGAWRLCSADTASEYPEGRPSTLAGIFAGLCAYPTGGRRWIQGCARS